jgi:integrase
MYLSEDEVERLMNAAELKSMKDLRDGRVNGVLGWMIVDAALQTGLRVKELASLRVEDIDLRQGSLYVQRVKKRRSHKAKRVTVQNAKPKPVKETLAISPELAGHLREFIQWRAVRIANMEPERVKGFTEETGPLFVGQRGPLTSRGGLQLACEQQRQGGTGDAGELEGQTGPEVDPLCRHTMGVRLLKRTGNLYQVQRQLGHASPATTANFYCDVAFEDMQAGVTGLFSRKKDAKRRKK